MNQYFKLQFKILNRKLVDFGLPAFVGYALLTALFIMVSNQLFVKINFAQYLYGAIAMGFVSKKSENRRNDFIRATFGKYKYLKIRILENLIVILPFIIFLIYKEAFVSTLIIIVLALIMAILRLDLSFNYKIMTPFGKKPFEFTVGFRKTFYIFPIVYFLTYISISVGNSNLGIFALLMMALICWSFYLKPENEYFVWNYSLSPREFLLEKIKTGLINFTFLSTPIILALGIAFFDQIFLLIVSLTLCYLYIVSIIFIKYAAFPNEVNLVQGILIALSIMLPPLLFVIIPLFYCQSIKKLKPFLE